MNRARHGARLDDDTVYESDAPRAVERSSGWPLVRRDRGLEDEARRLLLRERSRRLRVVEPR